MSQYCIGTLTSARPSASSATRRGGCLWGRNAVCHSERSPDSYRDEVEESLYNTMHNATYKKLASQILNWYADSRRNLPWRHTRNPYYILVSEVMLQQTQVERAVP